MLEITRSFKTIFPSSEESDQVMLIIRKVKIESDPLSLFTGDGEYDEYGDFEYDEFPNGVDGYEVNLFSRSNPLYGSITPTKKFIESSFLGNRDAGDIGLLIKDVKRGGVQFRCKFSDEIRNKYFSSLLSYYTNIKPSEQVRSLLIESDRNNKIDIIND